MFCLTSSLENEQEENFPGNLEIPKSGKEQGK